MNRDEAKYILQSYPLGGRDADAREFREALEMLKQDPELAAWFAQERSIDQKLSQKFQAFPVPPELKGQLLAARKIVSMHTCWRSRVWGGAAAACVALVAALAFILTGPTHKEQLAEYRSFIADTAAKLNRLDLETTNMVQIREWLANHSAPEGFVIPAKLNQKSRVGCRLFSWNDQKISLICFELGNNKTAHLFVMDRSALGDLPGNTPKFQTSTNGIATATWSDPQRVYIVALKNGEDDLKRLLLL
jgi:hypothetical protein